jgi:hypothetical protein
MIRFYQPRLMSYVEILENLGKPGHPELQGLYKFISRRSTWSNEIEMLSQLVDWANALVVKYPNSSGVAVQSWKYIEFLARVRIA